VSIVHVFSSNRRFGSHEALRAFVHPTYTEDGDEVPSRFMAEVGIDSVEPACIEVAAVADPKPLRQLLEGASYGDQWIHLVSGSILASEAICVFEPNGVARPSAATTVSYCGTFQYVAK